MMFNLDPFSFQFNYLLSVPFPTMIEMIINRRLCWNVWQYANFFCAISRADNVSSTRKSHVNVNNANYLLELRFHLKRTQSWNICENEREFFILFHMSHNITHVTPACSRVRRVVDLWRDLYRRRQPTHTSLDFNKMEKICEQNASTHLMVCWYLFKVISMTMNIFKYFLHDFEFSSQLLFVSFEDILTTWRLKCIGQYFIFV